jgi:hypothetical protein
MDKKNVSSDQLRQPPSESESEKKQSPKDMIRALQGVFCKGRYCSWVAAQEFLSSQKLRSAKKHSKSATKNKHGGQNGDNIT